MMLMIPPNQLVQDKLEENRLGLDFNIEMGVQRSDFIHTQFYFTFVINSHVSMSNLILTSELALSDMNSI